MNETRLFYTKPAESWEEALPLGNGRLGMMVYGGTDREILQLNEETLWCGCPQDADNPECLEHLEEMRSLLFAHRYAEAEALCAKYLVCRGKGSDCEEYGSYQTAGSIIIEAVEPYDVSDFWRSLDLTTGLARSECAGFSRICGVSDRFDVTFTKIRTDVPLSITFEREEAEIKYNCDRITVNGSNQALSFAAEIAVAADSCTTDGSSITVGSGEVVIYCAVATDYASDCAPLEVCRTRVDNALAAGYEKILSEQTFISQAMASSGSIDLCGAASEIPTDERLAAVIDGGDDSGLVELYFNYGKYLLICSSKGMLPANLQGIWADGMWAPWNGDYHININLQMNYWHAEPLGLSKYCEPLFRYIEFLAENGADTARIMYGCRGWVAHTNTNPWGFTSPGQDPAWGSFMCAGAWCCRHIFEHYLYTLDVDFLRRYYPLIRGSALFFTDFLTEDPDTGYLVTAPSNSPENHYIDPETSDTVAMCAGPSMDNSILYELFDFAAQSAQILGVDCELSAEWRAIQKRLPPLKTGKFGQIMEWQQDFDESEPGHRHISHLYGLYPAALISESGTPELYKASAVTLERRLSHGGGHTGWSRAWIINFYARLHDGEKAGRNLHDLLAKSTLPNLFDFHPPFQIDGNFGGTAGIAEMLLQSHQGFIELLPALPPELKNGSFRDFRARGGFTISAQWADGVVSSCTVSSQHGGAAVVKLNGKTYDLKLNAGEKVTLQ